MITQNTTNVFVRVDLASMRVVGVSDEQLIAREGAPVFQVASNQSNLDYYIVEKAPGSAFGITVRPATAEERSTADAAREARAIAATQKIKFKKAQEIKAFYDNVFTKRFYFQDFMTVNEGIIASNYTGTNETILNTFQPKARKVENAYIEWRFLICQPVIDAMYADATGTGVELNDKLRLQLEDDLDAFLTDRDFDITVYHR